MEITLNSEQQHFVIASGNSYSCMGFQVVYEQTCELARRLLKAGKAILQPSPSEIGTLEQYNQYQSLFEQYRHIKDSKTWFDARTPKAVQKALEELRLSEDRVRVFCGDTETGLSWMEEYDTIGRIGRSMGPMKSPLLIPENEHGGPAILTHCIVRIVNLATGRDVYTHKEFHTRKMQVVDAPSYEQTSGYTHSVLSEVKSGEMETCANFKSYAEAAHWVAFMAGQSHDYPTE